MEWWFFDPAKDRLYAMRDRLPIERLIDTAQQVDGGRALLAQGFWRHEADVRLGIPPEAAIETLRQNVNSIFEKRRVARRDKDQKRE